MYNGRFLEVSSEQRKLKISSNRAFSIRTYLLWKILQESAKAPVFPASIQLIFSAFDKNSSASFRHQTTSHDKHVPQRLWLLTVFYSIDRFIHPFTRVCSRISFSIQPTRRYKLMEKAERWYIMCRKTVVEYLYVHTLLYVCRNASCRIVCKVVSMTQTNTALVFFLPEWNTFGIHLWNVVGWYLYLR